jgi:hypothetical protein
MMRFHSTTHFKDKSGRDIIYKDEYDVCYNTTTKMLQYICNGGWDSNKHSYPNFEAMIADREGIYLEFVYQVYLREWYVPAPPAIEHVFKTLYDVRVLQSGILLQTYGGGPEGGFAITGGHIYKSSDTGAWVAPEGFIIHTAHREWAKPWYLTKISTSTEHKLIIKNSGEGEEIALVKVEDVEALYEQLRDDDGDVFIYSFGEEF